MKQILFPLFLLFFCNHLQAQWTSIPMPDFASVNFIRQSSDSYWIGTDEGVFKSQDAKSWTKIQGLPKAQYIDGLIVGQKIFFYYWLNKQTYVSYSINDGATWKEQYIKTDLSNTNLKPVFRTVYNEIYIEDKNNVLQFKNNITFENSYFPTELSDVFDTENVVGATYNSGDLFCITKNNGKDYTCSATDQVPFLYPNKIIVLDSVILLKADSPTDSLFYTKDFGKTWNRIYSNLDFGKMKKIDSKHLLLGKTIYRFDGSNLVEKVLKNLPASYAIKDVLIEGDETIVISNAGVLKSSNKSTKWDFYNKGISNFHADKIVGNDENILLASLKTNQVIYSSDIGKNWKEIASGDITKIDLICSKKQ